jgi:hypothetical protein
MAIYLKPRWVSSYARWLIPEGELRRIPKRRSSQNSISTSLGEYEAHHLDNTFRNGETENKTWVHIPVFLFANKTIITFCKAVVTATAQATPTGP